MDSRNIWSSFGNAVRNEFLFKFNTVLCCLKFYGSNVTVALLVKLVPIIVTDVPPDGEPEVGLMLVMEGTSKVIVIEFEVAAALVPNTLVAVTLNVYVSPAVNELKVAVVAGGFPVTVTGVSS